MYPPESGKRRYRVLPVGPIVFMAAINSKDGEDIQHDKQSNRRNYQRQIIVHRFVLSGYLGQPTP